MTISLRRTLVLTLVAALTVMAAVAPSAGASDGNAPGLRKFEGDVLSKHRDPKTFTIRRENGTRIRFRVNRRTEFERIDGFSGLRRGMHVEVEARRINDRWVAREVERERD